MTDKIGCWLWEKPYRITMWLIVQMRSMLKTKLRCYDRSNWVWYMTKTIQDNDAIDRTSLIYAEIELARPLWLGVACDENEIRQWCDRWYKYCLRRKQNWVVVTYQIECGLSKNKIEQWHNLLNRCCQCRKWNQVVMTDRPRCHLW